MTITDRDLASWLERNPDLALRNPAKTSQVAQDAHRTPAVRRGGQRKYRNTPTTIYGLRFDSKAEARRYEVLLMQFQRGEIQDLRLQPEYTLQEAYSTPTGERIRAIRYRADFSYTRDGVTIVEDVKGMETKEFKLKAKLFIEKYPHLRLEIVK